MSHGVNDIRRAALDLLARREHSTTELTHKLSNKSFEKKLIDLVLETLNQEGLLSDQRFTEQYIHYRRNKGYGPLRIQAELSERGISKELIEQLLDKQNNAWHASAQHAWQKKFKHQVPIDYKTRAQHMRFLQYRGFTYEQISLIINDQTDE